MQLNLKNVLKFKNLLNIIEKYVRIKVNKVFYSWKVVFMEKYIEVGKIINTHGVKGDVKIDSWCDSVDVFCCLENLYIKKAGVYQEFEVVKSQPFKEFVLAHLKNVDTFEDANILKNKELYALRDDIPRQEGDVFIVDLIGLPVINLNSGKVYGKIKDVIIGVATDIYEIETEHGDAYMPVVEEFVKEVDVEKGVFVTPIEGMFYEI